MCLGISERQINRLAKEGVLARHKDKKGVPVEGSWNLQHCIADFLAYKQCTVEKSGY